MTSGHSDNLDDSLASMGVVSDTLVPDEKMQEFSKQMEEDDVCKVEDLMTYIQK